MGDAVEKAKAQLAEWVREAAEEQMVADVLRDHAEDHQRAAYYAEDKARRLRGLLAEKEAPDHHQPKEGTGA